MKKLYTIVQHHAGELSRNSLEVIKAGQELSMDLDLQHSAVILGLAEIPMALAGIQLDEVILIPNPELAHFSSEYYTAAVHALMETEQPLYLVATHTYQARDWIPRLAARLGRPFISDCVDYNYENGVHWVRQIFQGKINTDIATGDEPVIVSFQAGAFRADDLGSGTPAGRVFDLDLTHLTPRISRGERYQDAKGTVDLSHAEKIVSVGRGIGERDNLPVVEELAAVLNAELGSSRPVVDYGWLDHDRQVGSSGQTVMPKLYLAVGISGAIQHQVGMKNSNCIVAINKDANAPIFEIADYGLVADLHEVVPQITAALKAYFDS